MLFLALCSGATTYHLDLCCLLSVYLASCAQSSLLTPALPPTEDWPLDQVYPGDPPPLRISRLHRRSPFLGGQPLWIADMEKQGLKWPWKPNFLKLPFAFPYTSFPKFLIRRSIFFLSEHSFWNNKKEPFQRLFFFFWFSGGEGSVEPIGPQEWKPTQMQTPAGDDLVTAGISHSFFLVWYPDGPFLTELGSNLSQFLK